VAIIAGTLLAGVSYALLRRSDAALAAKVVAQ